MVVLAKATLRDQRDVFLSGNQEEAQGFLFGKPGGISSEGLRCLPALVTWPGATSLCLGPLLYEADIVRTILPSVLASTRDKINGSSHNYSYSSKVEGWEGWERRGTEFCCKDTGGSLSII